MHARSFLLFFARLVDILFVILLSLSLSRFFRLLLSENTDQTNLASSVGI
jgi:hypothetical protein